jgi:predicted AAA+ superfamily ATPase
MERNAYKYIKNDLTKKMVFLVGPRQVGKTWLSKQIMKEYKNPQYMNFDNAQHRDLIKRQEWSSESDLLVFDEIHKMSKWKNFIKGVFDTRKDGQHILVTGSARMDAFRKAGDSLAGRYYVHHLMPISLYELSQNHDVADIDRLMQQSGFPEPYLADSVDANKWRLEYTDSLLKLEVLEFQEIDKVNAIKQVYDILRTKVGSSISYANIARDIGISPTTVKKYIEILEALYIVFIIKPHTAKISRSILQAPKIYFYDVAQVVDEGARFENLLALALLTRVYEIRDIFGKEYKLGFIKTKEQKEVDFVVVDEHGDMMTLFEAKLSDTSISSQLQYFTEKYQVPGIQVVKNIKSERDVSVGLLLRSASKLLSSIDVVVSA